MPNSECEEIALVEDLNQNEREELDSIYDYVREYVEEQEYGLEESEFEARNFEDYEPDR